MNKRLGPLAAAGLLLACFLFVPGRLSAASKVKTPTLVDNPDGTRSLELPAELEDFLAASFPGSKIPKESDFNPEMLKYYYSRLIGVFPAIASGDFNGDKRKDYALLLNTADTKWGPAVEMIVLNGKKGGSYDIFNLGEVVNFKDDYISFNQGKLYKGKFMKGGWYISWDSKKGAYTKLKS